MCTARISLLSPLSAPTSLSFARVHAVLTYACIHTLLQSLSQTHLQSQTITQPAHLHTYMYAEIKRTCRVAGSWPCTSIIVSLAISNRVRPERQRPGVARAVRLAGPRAGTSRIGNGREITSPFLGILRGCQARLPYPPPQPLSTPGSAPSEVRTCFHFLFFSSSMHYRLFFLPVSAHNRLGSEAPRHYPAGAALAIVTDGLI